MKTGKSIPIPREIPMAILLSGSQAKRTWEDHVGVSIGLLLPADHPIASSFVSELVDCDGREVRRLRMVVAAMWIPVAVLMQRGCLVMRRFTCIAEAALSSSAEGLSGVSEKLASDYVKSYRCVEGTYLVRSSTVILCKDDLIGCQFGGVDSLDEPHGDCKLSEGAVVLGKCHANGNGGFPLPPDDVKSLSLQCKDDKLVCEGHKEDEPENELSCCPDVTDDVDHGKSCSTSGSDITVDLTADQKSFLNEPLDGGIRLLKCYISTSLPASSARDIFRKYSVEKMFADHLMESSKEELSFRTVVRNMKSRSNMMEIVLVNPNSWCCSGYCAEGVAEWSPKMNLDPVIKVMFFGICDDAKTNSRHGGERGSKEPDDEVFMLRHPRLELIKCLDTNKNMFPPSFSSLSGLLTSRIQR
ncbi:hypothetical protein AKJ16_DCAP16931 [Drosera capensis]